MLRKHKVVSEVLGEENVLTPSDLYDHEFKRVTVGGYKPDDVDEFLERVADVMEALIVQARQLKEHNEEQRRQLEEYRQMEQSLRSALVSSQAFSENVLEAARREAQALVEEARVKKEEAQLLAARAPEKLAHEIRVLKQQRDRLRIELLAILETHRRLLESLIPEETMTTPSGFFEGAPGESQAGLQVEQPETPSIPAEEAAEPTPEPPVPTGTDLLASAAWTEVFGLRKQSETDDRRQEESGEGTFSYEETPHVPDEGPEE